jgi:hypothetical protein
VLIGGLALTPFTFSAANVTGAFALVAAGVAGGQWLVLRRSFPPGPSRPSLRPARRWRAEAWPLVLLALFTNLFADIAILLATPFLPSAEVAVLGLCLKLALLVGFVVQVTQQMALPDLANARLTGDRERMRAIVRRAVLLPVLAYVGGCPSRARGRRAAAGRVRPGLRRGADGAGHSARRAGRARPRGPGRPPPDARGGAVFERGRSVPPRSACCSSPMQPWRRRSGLWVRTGSPRRDLLLGGRDGGGASRLGEARTDLLA